MTSSAVCCLSAECFCTVTKSNNSIHRFYFLIFLKPISFSLSPLTVSFSFFFFIDCFLCEIFTVFQMNYYQSRLQFSFLLPFPHHIGSTSSPEFFPKCKPAYSTSSNNPSYKQYKGFTMSENVLKWKSSTFPNIFQHSRLSPNRITLKNLP